MRRRDVRRDGRKSLLGAPGKHHLRAVQRGKERTAQRSSGLGLMLINDNGGPGANQVRITRY
jgi:hypothetical protein